MLMPGHEPVHDSHQNTTDRHLREAMQWLADDQPVAGTLLLLLGVEPGDPNWTPVPGIESPVVLALPG